MQEEAELLRQDDYNRRALQLNLTELERFAAAFNDNFRMLPMATQRRVLLHFIERRPITCFPGDPTFAPESSRILTAGPGESVVPDRSHFWDGELAHVTVQGPSVRTLLRYPFRTVARSCRRTGLDY